MREISFNVKAEFQKYLKRVGLPDLKPGSIQYIEIQRGFYAGFGAAFAILQEVGLDDEMSDEEGDRIFSALHRQVEEFWKVESERNPQKEN
jgi:hypothetical protein